MARRKTRVEREPRIVTKAEVADYIGRCISWFEEHREILEKNGYPQPLLMVGGYDLKAVDAWIDRFANPDSKDRNFDAAWIRACDGELQNPLSCREATKGRT